MTILQVIQTLEQAGFQGLGLVQALATVLAEDGSLDPTRIHVNTEPNVPSSYQGSHDVGLFQINTQAHPQYTDAQMQDPLQNAKAAYLISGGGTSWSAWSSWAAGTAQAKIATAASYVANVVSGAIGGAVGGATSGATGTAPAAATSVGSAVQTAQHTAVSVGDSIGGVATALADFANTAGSLGADAVNFVNWLGQPNLWLRLLLLALGIVLTLVGLVLFAMSFGMPKPSALATVAKAAL